MNAKTTIDASVIDPIDEDSWVLDFDMYATGNNEFDLDGINSKFRSFAERVYSVFGWIVTPEMLKYYGATE